MGKAIIIGGGAAGMYAAIAAAVLLWESWR